MADLIEDDITGDVYGPGEQTDTLGLYQGGYPHEEIDVATETILNQPDAIAEELHRMVDEWYEDVQRHIEADGEGIEKCHNCGHRWEYTGDKERATCPNCGNKTPVRRLQSDG